MKTSLLLAIACSFFLLAACQELNLENVSRDLGLSLSQGPLDDATIAKGLKEALSVGTDRAVRVVSQKDGYFGNQAVKILVPEKIRNVASLLGKAGFQPQVDEFVLSMNRAAEKAAPIAADYFVGAIREMTFADARQILQGGNTAATEYFRNKTAAKIHTSFQPVVSKSLDEVGATRAYKGMMASYLSLPFTGAAAFDLDQYVTGKAVDGLFSMLGEEERKIRENPAARTTELLRRVFAK